MPVGLQGDPARLGHVRRAAIVQAVVSIATTRSADRDGDEEAVAVGGEHPVGTDAGERHEGQQPAPAESEPRVDHGDRGIVVEGDDVKLVQVELGRGERVAAGEPGDLAGQRAGVARLALGPGGEPCGGPAPVDGPAGRGVGDPHAEGHVVADAQVRRPAEARSARGQRRWRCPRAKCSEVAGFGRLTGRVWQGVRGACGGFAASRVVRSPTAARRARPSRGVAAMPRKRAPSRFERSDHGGSFSWVARVCLERLKQPNSAGLLGRRRVACPRLRGHGSRPRDMPTKTWACHPTVDPPVV